MDEVWSRSGGDGTDALAAITGRWDYTTLPENVHLGEGCFIESADLFAPFASTRRPGMVLGNRVRMYKGGWGGSLSVKAEGLLEIGDDSVLVGAQIMCAAHVSIGRRVIVSYNAVIADSDFHPRDPELRRSDAISGAPYGKWTGFAPRYTAPVAIEDDVSVGINAIILKGTRIGAGATVFAGAVVTRDVAPGTTVAGNPAIVIGGEG